MSSTASSTSSDVSPIALDNAGQLEAIVDRLRESLAAHISEQCEGDATAIRAVEELFEKDVFSHLTQVIQQNITVKGMKWSEHAAQASQTTQSLDNKLLRDTIAAQEAAFQLSHLSCQARLSKPSKLASQVNTRIQRVINSGADKSALLEQQRKRREDRRRLVGATVERKEQAITDLHNAEHLLAQAATSVVVQNAKARRAEDVSADVAVMQQSLQRPAVG